MARRDGRDRGLFERPRGSGIWWIRYADAHGVEHRERVGKKSLARDVYARRRAAVVENRFNADAIRRNAVSLDRAIDGYLARKAHKPSIRNMKRIGEMWKRRFAGRTLREIEARDVELVEAERRQRVSEQTVYHDLSFLRAIFREAIEDGRAVLQVVRALKRPNNGRIRYLTDEEEPKLYRALPPRWHPLLTIALQTGMRQGEQFPLQWPQVDLAARVVMLPKTKSGKGRIIELNDVAVAVLRALPSRFRSSYVFISPRTGRKINARNFYRRTFLPALAAAGITDFVWHDIRHTYATRLVQAGTDLRTVADLLGHSSLQMVMRYAHLVPGARARAVNSLKGPQMALGRDEEQA